MVLITLVWLYKNWQFFDLQQLKVHVTILTFASFVISFLTHQHPASHCLLPKCLLNQLSFVLHTEHPSYSFASEISSEKLSSVGSAVVWKSNFWHFSFSDRVSLLSRTGVVHVTAPDLVFTTFRIYVVWWSVSQKIVLKLIFILRYGTALWS